MIRNISCNAQEVTVLLLYCDFGIWSRATRLKAEKAQFMKKSCLVLRPKQHMILKKTTSELQRTHVLVSLCITAKQADTDETLESLLQRKKNPQEIDLTSVFWR